MANHPKRRKLTSRAELAANDIDPSTGEDRRGEAITVGWMLTMLATTVGNVLALLAALLVPAAVAEAAEPGLALLLPRLLLFVAAVTGLVCLLLTPAVYHFRRTPPPLAITVFGLTISVLPVLAVLWLALGR